MDDILERQKLQRERENQKFGAADFKFNTDVTLVPEACRVTCTSEFIW